MLIIYNTGFHHDAFIHVYNVFPSYLSGIFSLGLYSKPRLQRTKQQLSRPLPKKAHQAVAPARDFPSWFPLLFLLFPWEHLERFAQIKT